MPISLQIQRCSLSLCIPFIFHTFINPGENIKLKVTGYKSMHYPETSLLLIEVDGTTYLCVTHKLLEKAKYPLEASLQTT